MTLEQLSGNTIKVTMESFLDDETSIASMEVGITDRQGDECSKSSARYHFILLPDDPDRWEGEFTTYYSLLTTYYVLLTAH